MEFDDYTNVLMKDYTIENSNLNFFGLKWDASVSIQEIWEATVVLLIWFFCIPKCILTVKCNTLQIKTEAYHLEAFNFPYLF